MLGDSLYRVELFQQAEQELRRSLSFQPQNSLAHILLGNIAGKTNRFDDAKFHFQEAIAQDPEFTRTLRQSFYHLPPEGTKRRGPKVLPAIPCKGWCRPTTVGK